MKTLLERFRYICKTLPADTRIAILVIPHCAQVHNRYFERMKLIGAVFPKEEKLYDIDYPFAQELRKNLPGIAILNPMETLRNKEEEGAAMYYNNDPHLNKKGQEVIADFLINEDIISQ